MATLSGEKVFEATREGAKDAILEAMSGITDMPGTDLFDTIREAIKEAAKEWFDSHKEEIIKAIAKSS
jgi:hypothetical protein